MKIIVVLQNEGDLRDIKEYVARIDPERAEEIIYLCDPFKALEEAYECDGHAGVVVISGLLFGEENMTGEELAYQIKTSNPHSLFFLYGHVPLFSQEINGFIPKAGIQGHEAVRAVLTDEAMNGAQIPAVLAALSKNRKVLHLEDFFCNL